jgi:predicted RNA-binding Zn-ribbon protein involved in translation (DUF1610 family)
VADSKASKKWRAKAKKNHMCISCGKKSPTFVRCDACRKKQQKYHRSKRVNYDHW